MKRSFFYVSCLFISLLSSAAFAERCTQAQVARGCYSANDLVGHEDGSVSYMCVCPTQNDAISCVYNCVDGGGSRDYCLRACGVR